MGDEERSKSRSDPLWGSLLVSHTHPQSLHKRLRNSKFVNVYLISLFTFVHIKKSVDKTYDRIYGINKGGDSNTAQSLTHQERFRCSANANDWDWRGLQSSPLFWRIYVPMAVTWKSFIVLKTSLWIWLVPSVERLFGWPGHCVVLGRVVFSMPELAPQLGFAVPAIILAWCLLQVVAPQTYLAPTVMFMLQSERDIRHFYKLMKADRGTYLMLGRRIVVSARAENYRVRNKFVPTPAPISVHEQFFRNLMCFGIQIGERTFYKLRPNRTIEAHRALHSKTVSIVISVTIVIFLLAISFGMLIMIANLSDLRYVQNHPGCDPYMDELYESGKISGLLGTTLTRPHRVAALIADMIENHLVWGEFFLMLLYPTGLAYIFNMDLFTYWQSLHNRIETLVATIRSHRDDWHQFRVNAIGGQLKHRYRPGAGLQLDAELDELYHELIDFFYQFELIDKLVGDFVTTIIIAYLNWVFTATIWFANHPEYSHISSHLIVSQLIGILVIGVPGQLLLKMHRCCSRTHNLLCILIAHIQSDTNKRKLLRIFDFYQGERNLTGYKLFRKYTITTTTLMSLFGWTVSTIIVSSMFFERLIGPNNSLAADTLSTSETDSLPILGTVNYSLI